jgi:hypothetical protein
MDEVMNGNYSKVMVSLVGDEQVTNMFPFFF